ALYSCPKSFVLHSIMLLCYLCVTVILWNKVTNNNHIDLHLCYKTKIIMDLINKNVVITGGSTGIGFATAQAFITAGANVWITGRHAENLQKAAETINSPKLKTVVSDTSNLAGIDVLEKAVAESGSTLDVLFLNAGIAAFAPIEQTTEADFDAQFNTNVKGAFFTL